MVKYLHISTVKIPMDAEVKQLNQKNGKKSMRYILSHKDEPVLSMEIDDGTCAIIELGHLHAPERLPIGVPAPNRNIDRAMLNNWWFSRCIPISRAGLRGALDTLQITTPQLLLTKCYGLSLSDQYWVNPFNSGLKWEDINFFDNPFPDDVGNVLFGEAPEKGEFNLLSPDNTSDGWLKKKWIIADGKRKLIKSGSGIIRQEPYNEVLACLIMKRLDIPHVPYELTRIDDYPYCVCEDFITRDTELIAAWHITQIQKKPNNISLYQHYLNCCEILGIPNITDSIDKMLTLDYIIANDDRHLNNFGAIRDANTLIWIDAAPIFDSGTSMWCNEPTAKIRPITNLPSKPFRAKHSEQIKLVTSFEWFDIKALTDIDEEFREVLTGSITIDEPRRDALCYGLRKRVEQLDAYCACNKSSRAIAFCK